jgi:threonine/homoserine/homoserine lactone efflux protein
VPELSSLLLFLGATFALNVTPGPDMLYVLARASGEGVRAGGVSTLGISTGTLVHLVAVALGLASLLAAVPLAYDVVRGTQERPTSSTSVCGRC